MLLGMFGGPPLGAKGGNGMPRPPGGIMPPCPGGAPNGGGGIPILVSPFPSRRYVYEPAKPMGGKPGPPPGCWSIGFGCPSAAYELVIESITDCAFSCPIC